MKRPSRVGAPGDLLAQAEHGPESACVLVTPSPELAEAVRMAMAQQNERLATASVIAESLSNNGALLVTATMDEALAFVNTYATKHLQIVTHHAATLVESAFATPGRSSWETGQRSRQATTPAAAITPCPPQAMPAASARSPSRRSAA